jgi:hypothetical protein
MMVRRNIMLGRKSYTKEEIESGKSIIDNQINAYIELKKSLFG